MLHICNILLSHFFCALLKTINLQVCKLFLFYYRKLEIYSEMYWCNDIDISTSVVIAAPCGGPIIVIRDRTKLVSVKTVGKPIISVYTSSGKIISSFVVYY